MSGVEVRVYSLVLFLATLVGLWFLARRARRVGLPSAHLDALPDTDRVAMPVWGGLAVRQWVALVALSTGTVKEQFIEQDTEVYLVKLVAS